MSLGPSHYEANQQQIDVAILARRQLMIEKDRLLQFFDTSVAIQDDVLLAALKQDATDKMQDITTTIQAEQNQIIRDRQHAVVLVNGVAGSGKTSTIMQRIAYLLYSFRQQMSADNCLILSPNNRFIDYIADVLPALGEQTPLNLTILQFVQRYLAQPLENEADYFARISQTHVEPHSALLRSRAFLEFIKNADHTPAPADLFQAVTYRGRPLITKDTVLALYQQTPGHSLQAKVQATKKQLSSLWERKLVRQARSQRIHNQLAALSEDQQLHAFGELIADDSEASLTNYAYRLLTKKYQTISQQIADNAWLQPHVLFEQLFFAYSGEQYRFHTPTYTLDEAIAFLMIQHCLIEKIASPQTRYLFVDEVQDYTPAQLMLLAELFPKADYTMVGDQNQAIFNSQVTFAEIAAQFKQRTLKNYPLRHSYRSTGAITKLFEQLSSQPLTIVPVRPYGAEPVYYPLHSAQDLLEIIENAEPKPVILTKTHEEAETLQPILAANQQPVLTLPISLAKGLEFDHVLLYDISAQNYHTERDQKILYTAVSRSMQTLAISYRGEKSPLLP